MANRQLGHRGGQICGSPLGSESLGLWIRDVCEGAMWEGSGHIKMLVLVWMWWMNLRTAGLDAHMLAIFNCQLDTT